MSENEWFAFIEGCTVKSKTTIYAARIQLKAKARASSDSNTQHHIHTKHFETSYCTTWIDYQKSKINTKQNKKKTETKYSNEPQKNFVRCIRIDTVQKKGRKTNWCEIKRIERRKIYTHEHIAWCKKKNIYQLGEIHKNSAEIK